MANLNRQGILNGPEELVAAAAPQAFTNNWANMGEEQFVQGARNLALWLQLTVNGSTNMRVRLLGKLVEGGALEYVLPIRTIGASAILVEPEYIEFNNDADQDMVLSWQLDGTVPYVQFQIQVGAVGGGAATVDSAFVTTAF